MPGAFVEYEIDRISSSYFDDRIYMLSNGYVWLAFGY